MDSINTLCGLNKELPNVKAGIMYYTVTLWFKGVVFLLQDSMTSP
jgi:hypothetical protein